MRNENGFKLKDTLDFDYDLSLDDEIGLIVANVNSLVDKRDLALTFEANFLLGQFDVQSVEIRAFQQTRAKVSMDLDGATDDSVGERIPFFHVAIPKQAEGREQMGALHAGRENSAAGFG